MDDFNKVMELLNPILDCFAGADGGVTYVKLRGMLVGLQEQASEGDDYAMQIMAIVTQFSKLVKLNESVDNG